MAEAAGGGAGAGAGGAGAREQDRYLPGSHIPVRAPQAVKASRPDYVLILPWNLKDEITRQLSFIGDWGGRFVIAPAGHDGRAVALVDPVHRQVVTAVQLAREAPRAVGVLVFGAVGVEGQADDQCIGLPFGNQPGDAGGEYTGLPRARACHNEQRPVFVLDGFALGRIERGERRGAAHPRRSFPKTRASASGRTTEPSGCWQCSSRAAMMRGKGRPSSGSWFMRPDAA